ncbi:MAG: redoxin domain-containing protein [Acidobacteria bacterium]|nr:redoxin domain-containing protein [Acidobacteriota bacterium]
MDVILLIIRVILAGVLGLAAIAKLIDQAGSQKAMAEFGVPDRYTRFASLGLSVLEIGLSISLLFVTTSWFAAVGTAALLLVFISAMLYQVVKGNAPDCHCFGQMHSEPVGTSSIIRNILLFAASIFLVVKGRAGQGFSLVQSDQDVVTMLIGICVIGLLLAATVYLSGIAAKQNEILRRIEVVEAVALDGGAVERNEAGSPNEGLPIGAVVPDLALSDLAGDTVTLSGLREEGLPVLFFYVSPTCNPCKALVPEFNEWRADLAGRVRFVFLSSGTAEENRDKFEGGIADDVLLQKEREASEALQIRWTPTAILMDPRGRIASHMAAGDRAIRDLIDRIKNEDLEAGYKYFAFAKTPTKIRIGESIPNIELTDIDGRALTQDHFRGKETLVTFWSAGCAHCRVMMDELREWDITRGENDPNLVVFSDGDEEAHREFGLRAPVVIDKDHKNAVEFGMFGTPSAVLVDAHGKIITETAVGAPNIWSLIGRRN